MYLAASLPFLKDRQRDTVLTYLATFGLMAAVIALVILLVTWGLALLLRLPRRRA